MNKDLTELVFILDKSGSMAGLESDTIGGFNSMLNKQRDGEGECIITTVLFDHRYVLLHDRSDIKGVSPLSNKEYYVGGSTALLDAIGLTINKISHAHKHISEAYRPGKVMFVIMTDGYENSSRRFLHKEIRALIKEHKERQGWEFIFLGANIDAVSVAESFGINPDRAADYVPDSVGTELNFKVMTETVSAYRECGTLPIGCLDRIHSDMNARGGRGGRGGRQH